MFCVKCGKEYTGGLYCMYCGQQLRFENESYEEEKIPTEGSLIIKYGKVDPLRMLYINIREEKIKEENN